MNDPSEGEPLNEGGKTAPSTDAGETESCLSPPASDPDRLLSENSWDARSSDAVAPKRLGKYQILEQVGRGGMGVVWKARDPDLQRTVAIKVLAPHLAQSPVARRRFLREARAAAAISHPNVLTIHSVEEEHETPFLVMEYVSGLSLKEFISERKSLDFVEVLRLSAQVAQGLAAAHACGVIHRDIKPGNVMLHKGGTRARLTDFGLARAAFDNADLTSNDQTVGTPAYMAPEQVRGNPVDVRSDLFSLGCLMYALVSRSSPFQGRSSAETVHRILDVTPLPLETVEPSTPAGFSEVVMKLIAKKPEDRYQSAQEVAEILQRVLVQLNQAPSDQLVHVLSQHLPSSSANVASTQEDKADPPGRATWGLLGAGLLVLLAAIGLSTFWKDWGSGGPANSSSLNASAASVTPKGTEIPEGGAARPFLTRLTVGTGPDATCATIAEGVARGTGDCTIHVAGPGPYEESVMATGGRLTSLTITAAPGTIWRPKPSAAGDTNALTLAGLRRLRIEGFQFEVGSPLGWAIHLPETVSDVTIADCEFRFLLPTHTLSLMNVGGEAGDEASRVLIRGCRFQGAMGTGAAITVDAGKKRSPAIEILDSRFLSPDRHIYLAGSCQNLTVRGNVFVNGYAGLMLFYRPWTGRERMEIVNNTFLDVQFWLSWMDSVPDPMRPAAEENPSRLCNNLVLGGQRTLGKPEQWNEILATWTVRANWLEDNPRMEAGADREGRLGTVSASLGPLHRTDPASPQFLVPDPASPLATGGAGEDLPVYVGAREPVR